MCLLTSYVKDGVGPESGLSGPDSALSTDLLVWHNMGSERPTDSPTQFSPSLPTGQGSYK